MTPEGDTEFEPNDEADDARWVTPEEAYALLTHDRDREVVSAAV
jgi:8-oxo-dGTP diphosphatase